mmetsp:Transcript_10255/g.33849  ORF Transcript_10255/g.33849 Transcript_10255/m.33849 type:complete len:349 (+) Transcript_10255:3167-4213(+)
MSGEASAVRSARTRSRLSCTTDSISSVARLTIEFVEAHEASLVPNMEGDGPRPWGAVKTLKGTTLRAPRPRSRRPRLEGVAMELGVSTPVWASCCSCSRSPHLFSPTESLKSAAPSPGGHAELTPRLGHIFIACALPLALTLGRRLSLPAALAIIPLASRRALPAAAKAAAPRDATRVRSLQLVDGSTVAGASSENSAPARTAHSPSSVPTNCPIEPREAPAIRDARQLETSARRRSTVLPRSRRRMMRTVATGGTEGGRWPAPSAAAISMRSSPRAGPALMACILSNAIGKSFGSGRNEPSPSSFAGAEKLGAGAEPVRASREAEAAARRPRSTRTGADLSELCLDS